MTTEVLDWTRRDYSFIPIDGGQQGSVVAWGASPRVGDILALRNGDRPSCYKVTDWRPSSSADADVFTLRLQFIPGREMPEDAELIPHSQFGRPVKR